MQSIRITTQYAPYPNSNNGKIVAKALGRTKFRRYQQDENIETNHRKAAEQMLAKLVTTDIGKYDLAFEDYVGKTGWSWMASRKAGK